MIEIPQHLKENILRPTSENIKALFHELLDPGTKWHCYATAVMYAEFLAVLGVKADERAIFGALFHDIGKADELVRHLIRMKHLPRSAITLIRDHTEIGYDFIVNNGLESLIDPTIAKYHHSRHDGKGYPRGLAGEDIPFAVRAFSIVDAWDAIQRPNPGVKPRTVRDCVIGIASGAQSGQFDPRLTDVFLHNRLIWDSPVLRSVHEARSACVQQYGKR